MKNKDWAVVTPMANEEDTFDPFINAVTSVMDDMQSGKLYCIIDNVSKDKTLQLCQNKSRIDSRIVTIWAPENKNVVDAYIRGYKEALRNNHEYIIEMDAGMSHNPESLKEFLKNLEKGIACIYGSRFIKGGSMELWPFKRWFLSRVGTLVANFLLGTRLKDMTSGYQGFHRDIVKLFVNYPLKSTAHFYQTELKYLLRNKSYVEVPITYRAPSPNLRNEAIYNSITTLLYYFKKRLAFKSIQL